VMDDSKVLGLVLRNATPSSHEPESFPHETRANPVPPTPMRLCVCAVHWLPVTRRLNCSPAILLHRTVVETCLRFSSSSKRVLTQFIIYTRWPSTFASNSYSHQTLRDIVSRLDLCCLVRVCHLRCGDNTSPGCQQVGT
jgi:hypothetical protein